MRSNSVVVVVVSRCCSGPGSHGDVSRLLHGRLSGTNAMAGVPSSSGGLSPAKLREGVLGDEVAQGGGPRRRPRRAPRRDKVTGEYRLLQERLQLQEELPLQPLHLHQRKKKLTHLMEAWTCSEVEEEVEETTKNSKTK